MFFTSLCLTDGFSARLFWVYVVQACKKSPSSGPESMGLFPALQSEPRWPSPWKMAPTNGFVGRTVGQAELCKGVGDETERLHTELIWKQCVCLPKRSIKVSKESHFDKWYFLWIKTCNLLHWALCRSIVERKGKLPLLWVTISGFVLHQVCQLAGNIWWQLAGVAFESQGYSM